MPKEILDLIDSIIGPREEIGKFYRLFSGLERSHKGHAHYINILREIRAILEKCPTRSEDTASSNLEQAVVRRFADLTVSVMSLAGMEETESASFGGTRRVASGSSENQTDPTAAHIHVRAAARQLQPYLRLRLCRG